MEAAYVTVPTSLPGKSVAREVEGVVINCLQDAGCPLLSAKDSTPKRASRSATGV